MKFRIKILFIGIIVLIFLFSAVYLFLFFKGKAILINALEGLTHKKVSIDYFGLTPPFNLEINKIDIAGLVRADAVFISPSIIGFLTGRIALNEVKVIKPDFIYERLAPSAAELVNVAVSAPSAPASTQIVKAKRKRPLRLILKHLAIKDGRINFIDHTVGQEGIKITVKDINLDLMNLYVFPRSVITNFELKGKIPWPQGRDEGRLEAEGWLNFFKKDMQATLKVNDIDGVYLYPYYSQWVDLEKARIEKAKLNFTSNIQGLHNNVTAECRLELTDIVRRPLESDESEEKAAKITNAVLDIFRALNQGKIVLDFTIRTKMDRPEFGFGNIKMALEDRLAQVRKTSGFNPQDVLVLPGKLIEGTFRGLTNMTMAVVNGTISAGKEIGKVVQDAFKKEKK